MQNVNIRCWISGFGKIQLSGCKNKSIIWIYKWTHWATRWQPAWFRRVVDFNRTILKLTVQVYWRPGLSIRYQLSPDLDPHPRGRSGTVANTNHSMICPLLLIYIILTVPLHKMPHQHWAVALYMNEVGPIPDAVAGISPCPPTLLAANTVFLYVDDSASLIVPKMQDHGWLRCCWRWLSRWGSKGIALCFAYTGA